MRKISTFFVIGLIQLGIDTAIYLLLTKSGMGVGYANALSRFCAACLGYVLNSKYTFSTNPQSSTMFLRFILYWLGMTLLGSAVLIALDNLLSGIAKNTAYLMASKIAVEGFLFMVSYLVAKLWVFKK